MERHSRGTLRDRAADWRPEAAHPGGPGGRLQHPFAGPKRGPNAHRRLRGGIEPAREGAKKVVAWRRIVRLFWSPAGPALTRARAEPKIALALAGRGRVPYHQDGIRPAGPLAR